MPNHRLSLLTCLALLVSTPVGAEEGKKYALLVGVKEYDHFKLSPLKYTENDVTELAQLLRPAGFDVSLLTDSEGAKPYPPLPALWYRKAAEQNNPWAQNSLGDLYYYGKGVGQNAAEAAQYYQKAAQQGWAPGQYSLGYLHEFGEGVTKSDSEAYRWYKKAAGQGNADAIKRLKARGWQ